MKEYVKQQLYFDTENEYQSESCTFLNLCGRKTTKYLSFIIHSFLKEHNVNVDICSPEDIRKLMEFLETPIAYKMNFQLPDESRQDVFIEKKDDENDEMSEALAAFG